MAPPDKLEPFINRWGKASGTERAKHQLFITELCGVLEVPPPEPAIDDVADNAYVFERRVTFAHGDGSQSFGFIDCYHRGRFVLEAKKLKLGAGTRGFDEALLRARTQAENYARALPASEGRPPFVVVVVVDVGQVIELYAEFTRSGATYTPFPDSRSHRLPLARLREPAVRERLRLLWQDPMALDPRAPAPRSRAKWPHAWPRWPKTWKKPQRHQGSSSASSSTRRWNCAQVVAAWPPKPCTKTMAVRVLGSDDSMASARGRACRRQRWWRWSASCIRRVRGCLCRAPVPGACAGRFCRAFVHGASATRFCRALVRGACGG